MPDPGSSTNPALSPVVLVLPLDTGFGGHQADSDYVSLFWLPTVGPTAAWALIRLHRICDRHPDGAPVALEDLAAELGVGKTIGKNSPIVRGLHRLAIFGLLSRRGNDRMVELHVRRPIPSLAAHNVAHLPTWLQTRHQEITRERVAS